MANVIFPDIPAPSYPIKEDPEDNSIMSTFEDGTTQARRRFTKSRMTFGLTWNSLYADEYQKLKDFVQKKVYFAAVAFEWTNPHTGVTYTVRCTKFSGDLKYTDYYSAEMTLQEV